MDISGIIRVKKHSAFRFRFESFTFRQVKLEGRYLGVLGHNFIAGKNGIFIKM
jgi:hypothetical protein